MSLLHLSLSLSRNDASLINEESIIDHVISSSLNECPCSISPFPSLYLHTQTHTHTCMHMLCILHACMHAYIHTHSHTYIHIHYTFSTCSTHLPNAGRKLSAETGRSRHGEHELFLRLCAQFGGTLEHHLRQPPRGPRHGQGGRHLKLSDICIGVE